MGDRPRRDLSRDAWLRERGVTVMRVSASELTRAVDDVADAVVRLAAELIASNAPSTALAA
jgi:very-short-patch-repair endonuclease